METFNNWHKAAVDFTNTTVIPLAQSSWDSVITYGGIGRDRVVAFSSSNYESLSVLTSNGYASLAAFSSSSYTSLAAFTKDCVATISASASDVADLAYQNRYALGGTGAALAVAGLAIVVFLRTRLCEEATKFMEWADGDSKQGQIRINFGYQKPGEKADPSALGFQNLQKHIGTLDHAAKQYVLFADAGELTEMAKKQLQGYKLVDKLVEKAS